MKGYVKNTCQVIGSIFVAAIVAAGIICVIAGPLSIITSYPHQWQDGKCVVKREMMYIREGIITTYQPIWEVRYESPYPTLQVGHANITNPFSYLSQDNAKHKLFSYVVHEPYHCVLLMPDVYASQHPRVKKVMWRNDLVVIDHIMHGIVTTVLGIALCSLAICLFSAILCTSKKDVLDAEAQSGPLLLNSDSSEEETESYTIKPTALYPSPNSSFRPIHKLEQVTYPPVYISSKDEPGDSEMREV